ncbi:hypothetical protein HPB50_018035 [Hyalomma asiaticum]|uniref:Uncharacterized protein n=1 Tax=Hyalomma asiaticum TaxID=266040 RepID=A0ACB7S8A1_HYAAI|nr:hypothetical protein HPB50_018035 [Hyalomma asiaticum]
MKESVCVYKVARSKTRYAQQQAKVAKKRHTYALPTRVKGACIVSSVSGQAANAKVRTPARGDEVQREGKAARNPRSSAGCSGGTRARVLRLRAYARRGGPGRAGECRARFRKETARNRRRVRDTAKASQPEPRTRPRSRLWVPEHLSQYVGAAAASQRSSCCSDTRQYRT